MLISSVAICLLAGCTPGVRFRKKLSIFRRDPMFKESCPHVKIFCFENDSYMDAIEHVKTLKWCFVIPKLGK